MKYLCILFLLLTAISGLYAQTAGERIVYKESRLNQKQRLITLDLGGNYSNAGKYIFVGDTVQWPIKSKPGIDLGVTFTTNWPDLSITEQQLLFNVERQMFNGKFISSTARFSYYLMFGYRLTDHISAKCGIGGTITGNQINKNQTSQLYNKGWEQKSNWQFKIELNTRISKKITLGYSWSTGFKHPEYSLNKYFIRDNYRSMLFSVKIQYCFFDKQSLIQNHKTFLKFTH